MSHRFAMTSISIADAMPELRGRIRSKASLERHRIPEWGSEALTLKRLRRISLVAGVPSRRRVSDIALGAIVPVKREPRTSPFDSWATFTSSATCSTGYVPSASTITRVWPRDASTPALIAAPYPRFPSATTRALAKVASYAEASVDPLSATITSWESPARLKARAAISTHARTLSASFRHGKITETSTLRSELPKVASKARTQAQCNNRATRKPLVFPQAT